MKGQIERKRLSPLPEIKPEWAFYREEPAAEELGYTIKVMHVGAIYDILDEMKATLENKFDEPPEFEVLKFSNEGRHVPNGENTEYIFKGKVNGVQYIVSIENIACPMPFPNSGIILAMPQIHHASVAVAKDKEDHLSPIIKQEFMKYETELKASITEAEKKLEECLVNSNNN